jgi:large subunit ribosomal protein L9
MKVILTQDVRGQGKRGQMIEVSDGYARNFLLPRKLAQEATADNINTMRMNDKATQERQAKERAEALELRNRMKDMTVVVTAKGGGAGRLFGSVTNTEVSEALAKQAGIQLDKRKIVIVTGRSFWTSRSSRSAFTPSSASSAMRSTQNSKSRSRKPKCA